MNNRRILTDRDRDFIIKTASPDITLMEIVKITKTKKELTRKILNYYKIPYKRLRKPNKKRDESIEVSDLFNWAWARQVEPLLTAAV